MAVCYDFGYGQSTEIRTKFMGHSIVSQRLQNAL